MREDGWTQGKLNIFYPAARGFKEWDFSGWPCEKHGQNIPHPATKGNAACRNAAFDIATNTLFCFYDYDNNLNLVAFRLDSKTIEIWTVGSWWHPDGRRFFLEAMRPPSPEAVTEDGFAYLFPDNGRWYSACNLMWEHSATWVNPADGKLYAISPQTGYQWCFETRAGVKTGPDGQDRIPFYPVGKRIELNGCWPSLASHFNYPPTTGGADVRMNSFMAPFKGGILWWTSGPYGHGVTGIANMMAWRRLGNEGPWTTVTCPNEFSANALAPKSLSAGNDEVLAISQASTTIDLNYTPWFWRITP
jgi:hypothetical protein